MDSSLIEVAKELDQLAKDQGVMNMKLSTTLAYVNRQGAFSEEPMSVGISGDYDPSKADPTEEFSKKANELLEAKKFGSDVDINPKLKGMKFPTLHNLFLVMKKEDGPKELAPVSGEVTLFDFWATWCGPCQGPMSHNQEMLTKHTEWAGKARIVGVSIDNDLEAPKKRVVEKGWTKVDHYWAEGAWKSEACAKFGIHGIPFCVLVDKEGVVRLTGHPAGMDLEKNIPLLIEGKTISGGEDGGSDEKLVNKSYTYEESKKDLEAFVKEYDTEIKKVGNALIASVHKKTVKEGKVEPQSNFIIVRFTWNHRTVAEANKLKAEITKAFAGKTEVKLQDREQKLFILKFGSKCHKCGKALGTCDQYNCTICKDIYFCPECVEPNKTATKKEELCHPHAMYYIQKQSGPLMEDITLGDLKEGAGVITNKDHRGCRCDCCGSGVVGIRWKCVLCGDVDACESCMTICKNPADPKYAELVAAAKKVNHDMSTHVYLRLEYVGCVSS